ncbi:MAG: hypothetical protein DPW16_00290 [Chloroflexi bacterium]|nr:hypothetical protein [Chloroflexota bacterium]
MTAKRWFLIFIGAVLIVTLACSVYIFYRLLTENREEKNFFREHKSEFSQVVTLVQGAPIPENRPVCVSVSLTQELQDWIGQQSVHTCYDKVGEVYFVDTRNPFGGDLFCYMPSKKQYDSFNLPDGLGGTLWHKLEDGWFLCSLSID